MYLEAIKLHLIEEVLKADSEFILAEVENVFNIHKHNPTQVNKPIIDDFVGIISEEDADEMKRAIAETCENIDEDDWK